MGGKCDKFFASKIVPQGEMNQISHVDPTSTLLQILENRGGKEQEGIGHFVHQSDMLAMTGDVLVFKG